MTNFPIFKSSGNPPMFGHRSYIGVSRISVWNNQDEALCRLSLVRQVGPAWDAFVSDERPGSWMPSVLQELGQ